MFSNFCREKMIKLYTKMIKVYNHKKMIKIYILTTYLVRTIFLIFAGMALVSRTQTEQPNHSCYSPKARLDHIMSN